MTFLIQISKKPSPYWRATARSRRPADCGSHDYDRCQALRRLDAQLMADLRRPAAKIRPDCALAYRQCVAANSRADATASPFVSKEISATAQIGTVDVIYPMAPQFLLFTRRWPRDARPYSGLRRVAALALVPFAPHDLARIRSAMARSMRRRAHGTGPDAVEESGTSVVDRALAQVEGKADFAAKYWPVLEKMADYLRDKGFDPKNQLCTDDFAGISP